MANTDRWELHSPHLEPLRGFDVDLFGSPSGGLQLARTVESADVRLGIRFYPDTTQPDLFHLNAVFDRKDESESDRVSLMVQTAQNGRALANIYGYDHGGNSASVFLGRRAPHPGSEYYAALYAKRRTGNQVAGLNSVTLFDRGEGTARIVDEFIPKPEFYSETGLSSLADLVATTKSYLEGRFWDPVAQAVVELSPETVDRMPLLAAAR